MHRVRTSPRFCVPESSNKSCFCDVLEEGWSGRGADLPADVENDVFVLLRDLVRLILRPPLAPTGRSAPEYASISRQVGRSRTPDLGASSVHHCSAASSLRDECNPSKILAAYAGREMPKSLATLLLNVPRHCELFPRSPDVANGGRLTNRNPTSNRIFGQQSMSADRKLALGRLRDRNCCHRAISSAAATKDLRSSFHR